MVVLKDNARNRADAGYRYETPAQLVIGRHQQRPAMQCRKLSHHHRAAHNGKEPGNAASWNRLAFKPDIAALQIAPAKSNDWPGYKVP